MGVKVVATPCLQCSTMNFCSKKRALNDVVLASRSIWLGTMSSKLRKSRSFEFNSNHHHQQRSSHSLSRACSVSFDSFSDEEFYRKIDDLTSKFQLESESESETELPPPPSSSSSTSSMESRWFEIEMKAKSVDLPLSLRMIKKKKIQVNQQLIEASESAYCSVKKAFSSMVFIIRELHSYTLQMRELLFYEDLQGILARVQSEIHASFVWLFQQVFSHTPVLMVYIMILLANYTVHSVSNSTAIAVVPPTVEEREIAGDSPAIKSFSVSGGGKTTSIGGGNGGGGKSKAVASGMDGDGMNNRTANLNRPIISDGVSTPEEEVELWNSMVDEASRMKGEESEEVMDGEISLVSPVTAKIDGDQGYEEYFKTELFYQTGLAQEPNNVLLLGNYAQFLYLVAHDYDRAEEYFKRAISVEPKDAEAHNKYANFLWQVRNDLWAAEETFLEAISAEPTNSFYAANYAHFLWNTGGEDTCFPLSSPDDNESLD